MQMLRRHAWWVLLLAVLAAGVLWPRLGGREKTIPVPCADIVAGCALPQAGLHVRFDRQPAALQRFRIFLQLPQAREVHAGFSMRGMEMGFNRYRLLPDGPGRWQAEVMLPACVQGRSDWLMMVEGDGRRYEVPFVSG